MKRNMGVADRLIRFAVAAVLVGLYLNGTLSGAVGIVLLVLSGVFILTSFLGFCPLYAPLGISTCKVKGHS